MRGREDAGMRGREDAVALKSSANFNLGEIVFIIDCTNLKMGRITSTHFFYIITKITCPPKLKFAELFKATASP
jgi:hypothetical protein